MQPIQIVTTNKAPLPVGHYSQATVHNNTIYVAGLLGMFADNPDYIGTIEEQAEQALNNLEHILIAANSDLQHLLTVTIFMTDMNDWTPINTAFARRLGEHKPARAMLEASALPKGFNLEIIATAAVIHTINYND